MSLSYNIKINILNQLLSDKAKQPLSKELKKHPNKNWYKNNPKPQQCDDANKAFHNNSQDVYGQENQEDRKRKQKGRQRS